MGVSIRRTACLRDCPDACGLLAEVDGDRLVRLRGDPEHPFTQGFLCKRTSRWLEDRLGPTRLRAPRLRAGGRSREVSWDEALDLLAERIQEARARAGAPAVGFLRGGGSLGLLQTLCDRLFRALGPVTEATGDICGGAGTAAQEIDFGVSVAHDWADLENARHAILWGRNPGVSWVHLVPFLRRLAARGGRLLAVDPVPPAPGLPRHEHLAPAPGRDVEAALGVGRLLLEAGAGSDLHVPVTGLEAYARLCRARPVRAWARAAGLELLALEVLAEALAERPCALLIGWGLQRRQRGGAAVRALDALAAISGNLGIPGGGASFYAPRRSAFARGIVPPRRGRTVRWALLGRDLAALDDPPLEVLYVTCCNPVASLPDSGAVARALEEIPFVAVAATHENDTTRRADLVLPVAGLLETEDLIGSYGHAYVQRVERVVPPPPGVASDLEILQGLAARLGLGDLLEGSAADWIARFLSVADGAAFGPEALAAGPVRNPRLAPVPFAEGRVRTPDGRVRLPAQLPLADGDPPDGGLLWVLSNSHRDSQSSHWAHGEPEGPLPARVHPQAAAGIPDDGAGWLENARGRLAVRVVHDPRLRPDLVLVPKGGSYDAGRAVNALVEAAETDLGGGAAYLELRARLRPREGGA